MDPRIREDDDSAQLSHSRPTSSFPPNLVIPAQLSHSRERGNPWMDPRMREDDGWGDDLFEFILSLVFDSDNRDVAVGKMFETDVAA